MDGSFLLPLNCPLFPRYKEGSRFAYFNFHCGRDAKSIKRIFTCVFNLLGSTDETHAETRREDVTEICTYKMRTIIGIFTVMQQRVSDILTTTTRRSEVRWVDKTKE